MSDNNINNNDNKEKLDENWDEEIYDDGSRTNRRSKSEKRTWFVVSIIVILFLIVLIPTGTILYSQMSGNLNEGKTVAKSSSTTLVSSSSAKEESSTKESSSSTVESSSSTVESSSSTEPSTSESFADVEVPKNDPSTRGQVAQNETEQNQTQENTQNPQNPGGATVAYGESDSTRSLWKISQEAGITLDQLYQLNPGVTAENVQPGQLIRVQ